MLNPSCRYQVDAHDKIIAIEGSWAAFARANGGETFLSSPPINQPIWTFIRGLSTRFIYQMLLSQVRETGNTLHFPFRCDSAEMLRYMEMEMSAGKDNSVWFKTTLKRQINPNILPGHVSPTPRQESLIKMCAWCKLVLVRNNWLSLEDAIWMQGIFDVEEAPPISHGLCPDCKYVMEQEAKAIKTA